MYNYFDAIHKPSIDLNQLAHSALKKYMETCKNPKNVQVNVKEQAKYGYGDSGYYYDQYKKYYQE